MIEDICSIQKEPIDPASEEDVKNAILNMKNGKAADYAGMTAEHLKHAVDEITPALTALINNIFKNAEIPDELKTGMLTPVLKKGRENNS